MRILLLEDHDDTRKGLQMLLRLEGHEVTACALADEASAAIESAAPDVALLDVQLPGRTGDAFAVELLARHPTTRVIFVTGEYGVDRLKAAVPGSLVVRKPVDFDVLSRMLA